MKQPVLLNPDALSLKTVDWKSGILITSNPVGFLQNVDGDYFFCKTSFYNDDSVDAGTAIVEFNLDSFIKTLSKKFPHMSITLITEDEV